ncbi:sensor histidine kinase [Sphingobium phenoxybenzoativorans]|uniref:sensor histidine kinase n=1 Tax=Sphingobium phenoxybenzoativorans TaxID=1592790 RepID=UPI000872FAF2|nr:response regulator [Sphingobium phenoxybenzoativorans]
MADAPHILYIDDDEGLRRLTRRVLERRGYRVELAESGAQGVAMAAETAFDLVAVDHYMPGQDGLATLAQLRALPSPPPVIYVTGSEEGRIAVAALKAGAVDYVVKTVGEDFFDLLASAIQQALVAVRLRVEKEQAEAQLRASNDRLQALLGEVNHRVANSLQLVSAFVHMQARALADDNARAALEDTQRRIAAIAQVHKRLYTTDDVETVDMEEYLGALIAELEQTWSTPLSRRTLQLVAEPLKLATDKAVAVGIIVNELVSNACKYAYDSTTPGEVRVLLSRETPDSFRLRVEDDGRGMPSDGVSIGTGLGSKIVRAMADTLRTAIEFDTGSPGTRVSLVAGL